MNNEEVSKIIANIKLKTSFSGGDDLWGQALSVIKHLQAAEARLKEIEARLKEIKEKKDD